MSKISKVAGSAAKASAKAAGATAKKGVELANEKAPDNKARAEWLIRVMTSIPKYLRLYFGLLTDNRVSSKVKVLLVTAVAALGANFGLGGALLTIQAFLSGLFGPLAFLPTILILLITLDFCYTLIDADVLEEYEAEIFGQENSLETDVQQLRNFLGSSYEKLKNWWLKKADRAEAGMREEGLIVDNELTDEAIQDVSDQIVELETSMELREEIDKNLKLLARDKTASDTIEAVERKLLEKI
jgi:hypothetical protein